MASPASSSIPPHSTTNVGPLNTSGTGGCAPLGAVPPGGAPGGAPGGNPMYMLQWHEHHASFFRSVIVLSILISLHRLSHRVSHQSLGPKYVRAWSITLSTLEVKGLSNNFSLFIFWKSIRNWSQCSKTIAQQTLWPIRYTYWG